MTIARVLSYYSVLVAVALVLSRGASAEDEPPEAADCWEQIWADQKERNDKKKVVTDAIAFMQVRAEDPSVPEARRKWFADTCKALA